MYTCVTATVAEAYISTAWRRGSLVFRALSYIVTELLGDGIVKWLASRVSKEEVSGSHPSGAK